MQMNNNRIAIFGTIKECMLDYVNWFNNEICADHLSSFADFALSLRDVLTWVQFIADTYKKDKTFNLWEAYLHGASLMHLDGLGLGTGLSNDDAKRTKLQARGMLLKQITEHSPNSLSDNFEKEEQRNVSPVYGEKFFGIHPFQIPIGPETILKNSSFKMSAPTTALNLRRVLRAMQISKPILLEGSPGVGKTRYAFYIIHNL